MPNSNFNRAYYIHVIYIHVYETWSIKIRRSRRWYNLTILGRPKRMTSRLSSSDIAQQQASALRPRWLVVERYLKNLFEKSPPSVCVIWLIFGDLRRVLTDQVTIKVLPSECIVRFQMLKVVQLLLAFRTIRDWSFGYMVSGQWLSLFFWFNWY